MADTMTDDPSEITTPIKELSKPARRVLGVLVEKGITTPEYYPLTLKAITSGCNQKSNRSPITNYSEEDVYDVLEKLRELGLVAVVHTESGRTERFRHYVRKRFTLTEPQLAILTELLLRGKQQLGELRSRASRMAAIDTQEQLREALDGLMAMSLIQASGSLDRRGVDVDHNLDPASEGMKLAYSTSVDEPVAMHTPVPAAPKPATPTVASSTAAPDSSGKIAALEAGLARLNQENRDLHAELEKVRGELLDLANRFDDLKRSLGG
jgi:uncharacterized protein YceH (UPF0502 family)